MYSSKFTSGALEDVRALPKNVRNALKKQFQRKIHVNPRQCAEPLTGVLEGFWSFHYGDYRVVYKILEEIRIVAVVGIGKKDKTHFTDLYQRLENMAKKGKLAEAVLDTYRDLLS